MTWHLERRTHEVFGRNPLKGVVLAANFHPVLEMHEKLPQIQPLLRATFPVYEQAEVRSVTVRPGDDSVNVSKDQLHKLSSADGRFVLAITSSQLVVECLGHVDRDELIKHTLASLDAVKRAVGAFALTRVGMRYVNHIDTTRVAQDLGRTVNTEDVLSADYASLPRAISAGTAWWYSEVTSAVAEEPGQLTVRSGVVEMLGRHMVLLDLDRYVPNPASIEEDLLVQLSDGLFSVFLCAAGPALLEWMQSK